MFNPEEMQCYGTGTLGEKGQIVIPAKAREALKLKTGEEFIFFGHGPLIHMVKANQLNALLDKMTQSFTKRISGIKKSLIK